MKNLKKVNTHSSEAFHYKNYSLVKLSRIYNGHILGRMAKRFEVRDVLRKSVVFKSLDPISVLSFLHNLTTTRD